MRLRFLPGGLGALLCAVALGACSSSDAVAGAPATDAACGGGANVQLALLSATTLDCSAGTTITLPGDGAAYLVAVQLASGDVSPSTVGYSISVPSSAVASVQPASPRPALSTAARWASGGSVQQELDAALRAQAAALASRASAPAVVAPAGSLSPLDVPLVGSFRTFQVLSSTDFSHPSYAHVSAQLAYAGTHVLLYVDAAAPAGGFSVDELARFGRYFDEVLYPLDAATFGDPTDIDGNGRLIMLLSPVVNGLTSRAACDARGFIAGFFNPIDLSGGTSSNRGEIFYGLVPDPAGALSCGHAVADVEALLPATFLHEMQLLISYGQHAVVHHGKAEAGWLDEGLSLVAEELGAAYYESRYPGAAGRSYPGQLLPDSAEPFLASAMAGTQLYLGETDTVSLTTHSDADPGVSWRGGDWLLLRWLGQQKGGNAFYRRLEQEPSAGVAAVEAAAGEAFPALFGDFALALYADSLDGVPRTAIPQRLTQPDPGLRRLLAAFGGDPLEPTPLTGSTTAALVPGAIALYRISTKPGSPAVTLRFSTPAGAPLPAKYRPQVSLFRVQ